MRGLRVTRVFLSSCRPSLPGFRPADRRSGDAGAALEVRYTQFTLPNGLHVILHEDHSVPVVTVNVWYHVGSAREKPGRTGFAHLFEHLMFMGSGHVKEGEFDTLLEAAGGNNNGSTEQRPHQLLHRRAVERARARAVPRVGSHGLPARRDDAQDASTRQRDVVKNERRQSYENQPVRHGVDRARRDALSGGPSVSLAGDRLHGGSHRRELRGRRRRSSRSTTRRRTRAWSSPATSTRPRRAALVEKWFGDVQAGPRRSSRSTIPAVDADRRAEEDDHRSRAAAAAVPRVAHAARTSSRATRRSTSSSTCSPAARTRGSTSGSSTTCRSRRTSARSRQSQALGVVVPDRRDAAGRGTRPSTELQKVIDEEIAEAAARAADRARGRARAQPDRGVVLQPDGARRRLRRQGRSAERVLHRRPAIPTSSTKTSRAIARCRRPTSRPRPRSSCRSDRRVELIVVPAKTVTAPMSMSRSRCVASSLASLLVPALARPSLAAAGARSHRSRRSRRSGAAR